MRLFSFIRRNFAALVTAIMLAVVIWVSAVSSADPNSERVFPHPIKLEIRGKDPNLLIMDTSPEYVTLTMVAPTSRWEQLLGADGSVKAFVDLSGLPPGEYNLPIQTEIKVKPIRLISLEPNQFSFKLERLVKITYLISFNITGDPALGYSLLNISPGVKDASVSGPESLVDQVDAIVADLDVSGTRDTINATIPLRAVDSSGKTVRGVTIMPDQVTVKQPVQQIGGFREVFVKVVYTGQWENGYRLTSVDVTPAVVTVFAADPQLVNNLPGYVFTEELDLTGATDDIEAFLRLILPEGVSVVGDPTVLVHIGIASIDSNLSITLPVEIIGLAPGLIVKVIPETVDVILFGPVPVLETLTPDKIRVVVDVTGLEPGKYILKPVVDILQIKYVQEESILPEVVEVEITLAPTPSPTPVPEGTPGSSVSPTPTHTP